ncbi:MAG: papain-like cysteine protease family protein [Actinomycetota bacterium]
MIRFTGKLTYLSTPTRADSTWDFWTNLFGRSSAEKAYDATIVDRNLADQIFADQYAPRVARAFCDSLSVTLVVEDPNAADGVRDQPIECDMTMVSPYRPGALHLVSFRATSVPAGITRSMIRAVRVESNLDGLSPNSTTVLRMANVAYSNEYRRHRLVPNKWMRNDVFEGDGALVSTRTLTRSEERNPREEDRELYVGLIKHLNEFVEHYHQVIWWRMDPNRRFMLLDGFVAPRSNGRSLASVVENRLLSIVGNCLVMPVAPGCQLDPLVTGPDGEPVDLLEAYRPPLPFAPKRISLPTRGVHAEAILGECNSCEVRDDTRFWDWASEEIPNNDPTEISQISTSSRRQDAADVTPTDFPAPVVAIQNAPAAPDPTSIAALANLLGQENLFKDVTGLEQNQLNAQAAFEQALKTSNAFGKMAASGAKASFANRNSDRVMRKVAEAEESGLLSSDDAGDVVSKLMGVMSGDTTDSDTPLAQEPVVKKALAAVNAAPGDKSVTVTSSSGSTDQSVSTQATVPPPSATAAPTIDFTIGGIPPLQQPSSLSCWAVSLTMLISHDRQQSLTVDTALLSANDGNGPAYVQRFQANQGLPIDEVDAFRAAYGLNDVSFGALTASVIESTLRTHGPLWVIADEDTTTAFSVHARVVTGIRGDGTPAGTEIIYNDPATGAEERESLNVFTSKIDQLSNGMRSTFGGVSPLVLAL